MFGELTDLKSLRDATNSVDGVIHTAFNHDFSKLKENSEIDRRVIETLGEALAGSQRPLVVSSGTGLVDRSRIHGLARETDKPLYPPPYFLVQRQKKLLPQCWPKG